MVQSIQASNRGAKLSRSLTTRQVVFSRDHPPAVVAIMSVALVMCSQDEGEGVRKMRVSDVAAVEVPQSRWMLRWAPRYWARSRSAERRVGARLDFALRQVSAALVNAQLPVPHQLRHLVEAIDFEHPR